MKKPLRYGLTALKAVVSAAFLLPSIASAQLGHFVIISQGDQATGETGATVSSHFHSAEWYIDIGTGWQGTTTGAFLNASWTDIGSPYSNYPLVFRIDEGSIGSKACEFRGVGSPPLSGDNARGATQLTFNTCSGGASLVFDPTKHYYLDIIYQWTDTQAGNFKYYGSAVNTKPWTATPQAFTSIDNPQFIPYFAIVGNGFQITPTQEDSGVFFSGATAFCNDAFASSTGIGSYIGNGFCLALGYLFIPTPASLQQFGDVMTVFPNTLPFAYYYDVQTILDNATASTSENFKTFSIDFNSVDFATSTAMGHILPTTNFEFLSSTTISQYVSPSMHDTLFFLARSGIWVTVMLVLYRRIVPAKVKI